MICSLFTTTVYAAKKQDKAKTSKVKNELKKDNRNANNNKQKSLQTNNKPVKETEKPLLLIEKKQVKQKNIIKKNINQDLKMLNKQSVQKQTPDERSRQYAGAVPVSHSAIFP